MGTPSKALARYLSRRALGLPADPSELLGVLPPGELRRIEESRWLRRALVRSKKGLLYCGLCGRGPFTRKGLLLHLTRVHEAEIAALAEG